ncbi:M16 family metallopeptidase [Quisquiliibacterium transsilvanicum]|jgi:predicted Zn-dependent peptidase|uniref:Putative Zn-dependent peptidase n=1 Tax=Quisquiliibacterium transsilvanicum TaxID=1549638 RepID=A0A7W8HJ22_9BURK|nr:pitrilysin family protein [Quisquiliibacterium transsilvanicum]MBB5273002.1 putative Zn-dependent peptidase [Quisquiliibacterium transsilvanicum]
MTPALHLDTEPRVTELSNGVRVVALPLPHLDSASVSVFVRTGSCHEHLSGSGISHVVEHMAFKGTHTRSCQRINLDAERLGAEVNAHTDKDHTAYHMRGLARDAGAFVRMLADIVRNGSFPEAELERERQVILQELAEDDDDAFSAAYRLFDRLCYGSHPLARPVIGLRRNIERFTRDELLAYVRHQYSGVNLVVAAAGRIDPEAVVREAEAAFGDMPRGTENRIAPPAWHGGFAVRRMAGVSQSHVLLGYPAAPFTEDGHHAVVVASALFGEGMSSPLLDEIRERRGLAYYVACSTDLNEWAGQFVIEASMGPENVEAFADEVLRLLRAQAEAIEPVALERARNQIAVRRVHVRERPYRRLEEAALDLFALGRVRTQAERLERMMAVSARELREVFAGMMGDPLAVSVAGKVRAPAQAHLKSLTQAPASNPSVASMESSR